MPTDTGRHLPSRAAALSEREHSKRKNHENPNIILAARLNGNSITFFNAKSGMALAGFSGLPGQPPHTLQNTGPDTFTVIDQHGHGGTYAAIDGDECNIRQIGTF